MAEVPPQGAPLGEVAAEKNTQWLGDHCTASFEARLGVYITGVPRLPEAQG